MRKKEKRFKLIEGIKEDEFLIELDRKFRLVALRSKLHAYICDECILMKTENEHEQNKWICDELKDRNNEMMLYEPCASMRLVASSTVLSLFIMSYIRCDRSQFNEIYEFNETLNERYSV